MTPQARKLPSDAAEFDKELKPYRVMVRPLITGISHIAVEFNTKALDSDEQEGGVQAFSALMYQYGAQMDARVLVGLWVVGVTVPRVIHALKERNKKETKEAPSGESAATRIVNIPQVKVA